MGEIHTSIDRARGLTTHRIEGEVPYAKIRERIVESNRGELTRSILWDFRAASVPVERGGAVARSARAIAPLVSDQPRRTALVAATPFMFARLRRWSLWLESQGAGPDMNVFMDMEQALAWLGESVEAAGPVDSPGR